MSDGSREHINVTPERSDRPYAVRLAELTLGTDDPVEVTRRIVEFAKTYNDTESQIPYLDELILAIWALRGDETLPQSRVQNPRSIWSRIVGLLFRGELIKPSWRNHLAGLAWEAGGASVNWFMAHGDIPAEAAILWAAEVSSSGDTCSISSWTSKEDLCDFVICRAQPDAVTELLEDMSKDVLQFVIAEDIGELPEALLLLACCASVLDRDIEALKGFVSESIRGYPDPATAIQMIEMWYEMAADDSERDGIPSNAFGHYQWGKFEEYRSRIEKAMMVYRSLTDHVVASCRERMKSG